ncbi:hypothetical protein B0H11DRAFT_2257589 [Mycena galericulata]|nr:hypothetical protein B0H11DRAFT_2257589 [Mycena galericulata]
MSQPTYGIDLLYETPPKFDTRIPAAHRHPLTPPQVRSLYFLNHPSVSVLFLLCTDPSCLKRFPNTALSALLEHVSTALAAHHDSEQYIPTTTLSDNMCTTLSCAIKKLRPARKDWHKSFQDHGDSDPIPLSFKMSTFPPLPCANIIPFDYKTPKDVTAFALLDSPAIHILLQHLHAPPPTSSTLEPFQDVYTRMKDHLRLRQRIEETALQRNDPLNSFLLNDSIPPGNPALPRTFAFPTPAQIQSTAQTHIPLHSQGRPQSVSLPVPPPSTPHSRAKNTPSPPPPQTATTIRVSWPALCAPPNKPRTTTTTVQPPPLARATRASTCTTTVPPEQPARPTRASTRTTTVPPEQPARPTHASTRTNTALPQPPPSATLAPHHPPHPRKNANMSFLPLHAPLPPPTYKSKPPTNLRQHIARATEDLITAIDEYIAEHDTLPDTTHMPPELARLFHAASSPAPHAGPSTFPGAYTRGLDNGSA